MDDLLTIVKSTKPKAVEARDESSTPPHPPEDSGVTAVSSPEQALAALREQPGAETLHNVLNYLTGYTTSSGSFNIRVPGPLSAQIINTLVSDTITNYWDAWPAPPAPDNDKGLLLECSRSVGGLGAILARLKSLPQDFQQQQQWQVAKLSAAEKQIRVLLDALTHILKESAVRDLWLDITKFISAPTQRQLLWREFVSLTASGRLVSVAAQATDSLKSTANGSPDPWYASGSKFAEWVGRASAIFASSSEVLTGADSSDYPSAAALFLGKSFTLGYTDRIIWGFLTQFPIKDSGKLPIFQKLLRRLRAHEQRQFLFSFLDILSNRVLNVVQLRDNDLQETSKGISSSIALLQATISSSDTFKESLVAWLTNPASGSAGASFATRRVAIAALQADEDRICKVMERSMEQFGDELFIKHTPIMQQEALAQVLLMSCGYMHRTQPMFLFTLARSSAHMRGTSNRLGTSSLRARFLGMIAAMAISELIDKPENKLKFGIPETESEEADWYKQLTQVNDVVGTIEDFEQPVPEPTAPCPVMLGPDADGQRKGKGVQGKPQKKEPAAPGPRIIEIMDDSDEDDDLVPYAKPDSDPEDDSEDPTQVTRNKPMAPVYIRDLLAGLRENENYDRHQLALSTAASLIRRKADFGKEVKDNVEELASVLIGLNDQFDLDNFQEMRQQALVAVVLAEPVQMGPFLVRCFYAGDYSFSQRVAVLTAIGLSAREMAGFKDPADDSGSLPNYGPAFPSKMLPEKLHKVYTAESNPVDAITNKLKHTMISPLALDAADKMSGPSALKVRTFSSRMEVEKKRKVITNELAKIVAQSFFFPLTGGWWTHAKALGRSNIYYSPMILPIFLKTLAILLHSSGVSTLSLPQMTSELWDLLLSVRAPALEDSSILESVLFAFLTLLEINEDQQRLVQEHSRELLETQEWVKLVFDRTGGGSDEEERVRTIAAGVLVRCSEVVEKHQRLLMGDMMDF